MNHTLYSRLSRLFFCSLFLLSSPATAHDTQPAHALPPDNALRPDTLPPASHWGFSLYATPARALAADKYVKRWLKGKDAFAVGAEAHYQPLPSDGDPYARDYGYPTLSGGLRWSLNHGVTMHRDPDPSWGQLEEVDYHSRLGNTLSAYFTFERPFWRNRYLEVDGLMSAGVGLSTSKYNTTDAIDNEFIGSKALIYFGAGLQLTFHPVPDIGVGVSLQFYHHSSGALNRPNKGSNLFGPQFTLAYTPYYEALTRKRDAEAEAALPLPVDDFRRGLFLRLTTGVGAKTLEEEWSRTQFHTPSSDPDYRTAHFNSYLALSLQADLMYRYARRWASGVGVDAFYGFYADRVRTLDRYENRHDRVSPFSLALAAKHSTFYHNVSLDVAIGVYLYRHMGYRASRVEKNYYERIGVSWHIPALGGLTLGGNVKAHLGKADFTELTLGLPIWL